MEQRLIEMLAEDHAWKRGLGKLNSCQLPALRNQPLSFCKSAIKAVCDCFNQQLVFREEIGVIGRQVAVFAYGSS